LKVKEIATGLAYLHSQNVIHGDLQCVTSPPLSYIYRIIDGIHYQNNVLVNEAGQAVLADFGRAKVIGEEGYSTQLLAGSAAYMAPELLSPTDADVDELFSKKSDIYAFGMLCFKVSLILQRILQPHNLSQIFTNQEPFAYYNVRRDIQLFGLIQQGKRPVFTSDVRDQISQRMWRIMEACWTTAPASRPSAEQIVQRMP
jgi:serine/threonine protein kinase